MRTAGEWLRRIRYLVRRRRMDEDLRREMESHRAEMGEPARFGNTLRLREESRDVWGFAWIDDIARDTRHAFRAIVRMPAVAAVIVVSLGIGIGLNATVYTWIDAMMIHPIPGVEDASEFFLVEAVTDTRVFPGPHGPSSTTCGSVSRRFPIWPRFGWSR